MRTYLPHDCDTLALALVEGGALVVVNHSGGKDSQALLAKVRALVPASQILVVHAHLPGVEWDGTEEHARSTSEGLAFRTCRAEKTFLGMVAQRRMFPGPKHRQCTSDLKRGPIERTIRQYLRETGREGATVVNAMGMRAEESGHRSKLAPWKHAEKKSKAHGVIRAWYDWLPVHHYTLADVWQSIEAVGQKPHWAYGAGMSRLSCSFCLAGETEVVTRQGVRPIASLAGSAHHVLVPKVTPYGLSSHGSFQEVQVRSFGVQPLYKLTLHRGRQTKVVHATAEHRWFIHDDHHPSQEKTTVQLAEGMRLRAVVAQPITDGCQVPFAMAQGFVYGDGCKGSGNRPATLAIYHASKKDALLPLFAAHEVKQEKDRQTIYGLPRFWKELPPILESRSFLLSWLAGYFAADGCVSGQDGQARIDSANIDAIRFVRDIAAVCGIRHGLIRSVERSGFGGPPTSLFSLNLDPRDLPPWFFLLPHHRHYIESRLESRSKAIRLWTVDSVELSERTEEVFCAVVPGAQAFALADGLMTGNCIMSSKGDLQTAAKLRPELYRELCELEEQIGHTMFSKGKAGVPLEQHTGVKRTLPVLT